MEKLITRIAPTPSGFLHAGNVLSFLITNNISKNNNGKLILRIDDLDKLRVRPEFINNIFEILNFFGIVYQEGPLNTTDFLENYSQQHRLPTYLKEINKLKKLDLLYACTCPRIKYSDFSAGNFCKNKCRDKNISFETKNAAWKIRLPENSIISIKDETLGNIDINLSQTMGDFVILRKDKIPSYQIASLCDDVNMQVNYIVRGKDLITSTAAQLFLSNCLGFTSFQNCNFLHHPLLKTDCGEKLSKTKKSLSIADLIKNGNAKKEIAAYFKNLIFNADKSYFKNKVDIEALLNF